MSELPSQDVSAVEKTESVEKKDLTVMPREPPGKTLAKWKKRVRKRRTPENPKFSKKPPAFWYARQSDNDTMTPDGSGTSAPVDKDTTGLDDKAASAPDDKATSAHDSAALVSFIRGQTVSSPDDGKQTENQSHPPEIVLEVFEPDMRKHYYKIRRLLKPKRIYKCHYYPWRYADVLPAINQAFRCPFDPSHIYHVGSYGAQHLIKCRRVNRIATTYFDICDFDRSHYFLRGQMNRHQETCLAYQIWAVEQALRGLPLTLKVEKFEDPKAKEEEKVPAEIQDEEKEVTYYNWEEVDD